MIRVSCIFECSLTSEITISFFFHICITYYRKILLLRMYKLAYVEVKNILLSYQIYSYVNTQHNSIRKSRPRIVQHNFCKNGEQHSLLLRQ